ncbi:hypothetical protein TNIN_195841 [Trichonephila inaurata madagascariensis]|uniref:DUF4817 domain-containing protein n=1 Tax=Trichonephila inaurata madagascariensis TaxID=2747483 RepID=A0A8X6XF76_9ARAC|nr:hypothetical protein TNIN_195841 [Trichonephila inaurata madagascariensis]
MSPFSLYFLGTQYVESGEKWPERYYILQVLKYLPFLCAPKLSTWRPPNHRRHFVLWNTHKKSMSVITVRRNFRRQFGVDPPDKKLIKLWHTHLMGSACLCKGKNSRRSRSEETAEKVRKFFLGVSSSFQANFHQSLQTGYLENNKEKG